MNFKCEFVNITVIHVLEAQIFNEIQNTFLI